MDSEGIIKFECVLIRSEIREWKETGLLNEWRQKLYELRLIGVNEHGLGYGNISTRINGHSFLITGSGTGNLPILTSRHYSKVFDYNFSENRLICEGWIKASSESFSHAILYEIDNNINSVVHVHSEKIWNEQLNKLPTTVPSVSYETVELVDNIKWLSKNSNMLQKKIMVLGGHKNGVLAFGRDLEEAVNTIISYQMRDIY